MTPKKNDKNPVGRPSIAEDVHKIQLRVAEDVYQTLVEFADIQKITPTTALRNLLDEIQPTMIATVEAYKRVVEGQSNAFDGVSKDILAKTIQEAQELQSELIENEKK